MDYFLVGLLASSDFGAGELCSGLLPMVPVTKEADVGIADVTLPRVSKKMGLKMLSEVERV